MVIKVVGISDFVSAVEASCQIRRISFKEKSSKSGAPTLVVEAKGKQLSLTLAADDDCINDFRTVQFLKVTFGKSVDNWPEPIKNLVVQNAMVEPQAAAVPSFQGTVTDENNNSDQHGRLSFVEGIKAAATRWGSQDDIAPHERLGIVEAIKTGAPSASLSLVKAIQDSAVRPSAITQTPGARWTSRTSGNPVENNIQETTMDNNPECAFGNGIAAERLKNAAALFTPRKAAQHKGKKIPALPLEKQTTEYFREAAEKLIYVWLELSEKAQNPKAKKNFLIGYDLTHATLHDDQEAWQRLAAGDAPKAVALQSRFEDSLKKTAKLGRIKKEYLTAALSVYERARWSPNDKYKTLVAKAFVLEEDAANVKITERQAVKIEATREKILSSMQSVLAKTAQPA